MKTLKNHLRLSALFEGISFLILLGIAMPLKYMAGVPEPVTVIGWAHGVLFVWYVSSVLIARSEYNLDLKHMAIALAGSVLPFGTFYADNKVFKRL
jgi:integral membrane protein